MDGLSALINDAPEFLLLLPGGGTAREVSSQRPRERPSLGLSGCHPWPWTSTLRTISNKCLLLVDVLPVGFCYSGPGD